MNYFIVTTFILTKCILCRINGDGLQLNGSGMLHGLSNENINGDVKEVCYTTYIRIMMEKRIQEKRSSSFCKPVHLCPENIELIEYCVLLNIKSNIESV